MTRSLASSNVAKLRADIVVTDPKYGAKLDGVTDDTAAWQAALNDAATFVSAYIPVIKCGKTGVSKITSKLTLPNVSLIFDLQQSRIDSTIAAGSAIEFSGAGDGQGYTFRNGSLNGPGISAASGDGIYIKDTGNSGMRVIMEDFGVGSFGGGRAVYLYRIYQWHLANCDLRNSDGGIEITHGSNNGNGYNVLLFRNKTFGAKFGDTITTLGWYGGRCELNGHGMWINGLVNATIASVHFEGNNFDQTLKLATPTYRWTLSGSGTNEYYCELAAGGNPNLTRPQQVMTTTTGTNIGIFYFESAIGTLAAQEWAWGDNDALGFSTVYIRLAGATPDPDNLAATNFVLAPNKYSIYGDSTLVAGGDSNSGVQWLGNRFAEYNAGAALVSVGGFSQDMKFINGAPNISVNTLDNCVLEILGGEQGARISVAGGIRYNIGNQNAGFVPFVKAVNGWGGGVDKFSPWLRQLGASHFSGTLTANSKIANTDNAPIGQMMIFDITNNGAFTLQFDTDYRHAWSDAGAGAAKKSTIVFIRDTTQWVQVGAQSPYM